mmetsp:Transcript_26797/g.56581  ORF Transcript_26797/g.56581 Transcript_26797/m.56581 type:complete len:240 (-) Transcript_26797:325-1044(-)|eukprot:CAMPEP_0183716578 /NCGR_PEP_ID=MMETSP0737-20130205/10442_1 /TAXON_ID=385413 /ORGANISM="Thalassiosira miniscula, Strain CCMP1093" /LENGTH=239 /DNA_ID=CAMNT_0025945869 /DNA_START=330 /DNA_END=1049 /DNA_ORIENTATION=-
MRTALTRKRAKLGSADNGNTDEESLLKHRSDSKYPNSSSSNPANALFNKICLFQNEDNNASNAIIKLLQDIVSGIMLGSLGMCLLLLLDYSNIINLETARVFRKTASEVFSTPEMIESIEKELDRKLISMKVYNAIEKELSDSKAVIESEQKLLDIRTMKFTKNKAELATTREEYNKLMKEAGLDVFCPECDWGMHMNCQKRVEYLLETYSDTATTIECIRKLVEQAASKNGKCLKPDT